MRNIKLSISFSILISLSLFSCEKKQEESPVNIDHIAASLKSYMFETGSYWVYENDSTQVTDSISLISAEHDFFSAPPSGPGGQGSRVEYYKMNMLDNLTSTNYNDLIFASIISRNGHDIFDLGQPMLLDQFGAGEKNEGAQVIDTAETIIILGNTYYGVVKMKIIYAEQAHKEFPYDTYLYFKDSVGVVKKVFDKGNGDFESWSLNHKNIVF